MDAQHFDHLTRAVAAASPRRRLLALLASLPLLGGLLALLGLEEAEARKNRRKTRKKPHKRARRRRKKRKQRKKKQCKAHSRARTCANRCGVVKNNCRKKVNCGSCDCGGSCPVCETCNARTGICEPDPQQQGDACGSPGQVCQADGACACDGSSCAACEECQDDGTCSLPCGGVGCCDNATGTCIDNGQPCDDGDLCTIDDVCQNGVCSGAPKVCDTPAECQTMPGSCDGSTGQCIYPSEQDGVRCGNKCTQACSSGVCTAGTPVTCSAGICQIAGTCNPATGICSPPTNRPAGADCASEVPCGICDGAGACVTTCTGLQCCGTDGACHDDLQPCNPGANGVCCNGECTCLFGGMCRVSPAGAICCCTVPTQNCVDTGSGGTCSSS